MSAPAVNPESYDAVIVGGGPAGLEAALMLGRARRRVLLCDTGRPRNATVAHSHGFFSRDGVSPGELLAFGRADLARYDTVQLRQIAVTDAVANEGGFSVTLEGGATVQTRGIIVAAGQRDLLPDIPGFREHWGGGVFFCPYCHGYELRDQPLAVFGQDLYAMHMITLIKAWTADVTLLSNGPLTLDESARTKLQRNGIRVHEGLITGLEGDALGLARVRFADGSAAAIRGLLYKPHTTPGSDLPVRLGAAHGSDGMPVLVDPSNQTTVPGLFVAGDIAQMPPILLGAAASGAMAGAGLNHTLAARDAERA